MARKEELARLWERTQDYLFNQRPAFERQGASGYKPGLDTSIALSRLYNDPHRRYRIIHIAGTNGKGSVAHMLASCLQCFGYKVGLFTSPHLVDFRERIRVDGKMVSRNYVMQWVADFHKKNIGDMEPTFFELVSTMALDYFAKRNVNVAVIETGLGGRLDSTNIITPDVSIITNIGLEHQQFLGDTLQDIAREKAGIIKHGKPVIVGRADGVVRDVLQEEAQRLYSEIRFAQDKPEVLSAKHVGNVLRMKTKNYGTIDCELTGDYQVENVNTVLTTMNYLKRLKYRIKMDALQQGFAHVIENTGLMGRWMKLDDDPLTICDSAHNVPGFETVVRQLRLMRRNKLHMVLGFMADKDVAGILELLPLDAEFYFTQVGTARSMKADKVLQLATQAGIKRARAFDNIGQALDAARQAAATDDLIYVGGSMYLLAELLKSMGYGEQQE